MINRQFLWPLGPLVFLMLSSSNSLFAQQKSLEFPTSPKQRLERLVEDIDKHTISVGMTKSNLDSLLKLSATQTAAESSSGLNFIDLGGQMPSWRFSWVNDEQSRVQWYGVTNIHPEVETKKAARIFRSPAMSKTLSLEHTESERLLRLWHSSRMGSSALAWRYQRSKTFLVPQAQQTY